MYFVNWELMWDILYKITIFLGSEGIQLGSYMLSGHLLQYVYKLGEKESTDFFTYIL